MEAAGTPALLGVGRLRLPPRATRSLTLAATEDRLAHARRGGGAKFRDCGVESGSQNSMQVRPDCASAASTGGAFVGVLMSTVPTSVRLSCVALLAAPVLLLAADALQLVGRPVVWTFAMWLSFLAFFPVVFTLAQRLWRRAAGAALWASIAAVVGLMAGSGMMTIFRLAAVVREGVAGVPVDAVSLALRSNAAVNASIFFPGVLFPVGMVVFGAALYVVRATERWVAASIALGGILFPIGHAAGVGIAALAGDVLWLAALGRLALTSVSSAGSASNPDPLSTAWR